MNNREVTITVGLIISITILVVLGIGIFCGFAVTYTL